MCFFFFKQKTAYELRISDWSSDVCSSDLYVGHPIPINALLIFHSRCFQRLFQPDIPILRCNIHPVRRFEFPAPTLFGYPQNDVGAFGPETLAIALELAILIVQKSEEHTSELPSLMRLSSAVLCFNTKTKH